jgi:hypothetical protein
MRRQNLRLEIRLDGEIHAPLGPLSSGERLWGERCGSKSIELLCRNHLAAITMLAAKVCGCRAPLTVPLGPVDGAGLNPFGRRVFFDAQSLRSGVPPQTERVLYNKALRPVSGSGGLAPTASGRSDFNCLALACTLLRRVIHTREAPIQ